MYNNEIRKSILEQIAVPDFAEVCKHLHSPDYSPYTQNTLFTTKELMVNVECNQSVTEQTLVS